MANAGRRRVSLLIYCTVVVMVVATGTILARAHDKHGRSATNASQATAPQGPATTSAPPSTAGATPSIAEENRKPGNPDWPPPDDPAAWDKVRGFADRVSTQRGEEVGLYVTTAAPSFRVDAYRMGYYNGAQARLVWTSPPTPGMVQAGPRTDPATFMHDAPWTKSLSFVVGQDWPPGVYMLKLVSTDGGQSLVPLTVRDDSSHAAILMQSSVTTWQAYNDWGGANLYSGGKSADGNQRSRVVSFDRPYGGNGSGEYFGREDRFVQQIEAMGLDVTYTTDIDTHAHPELLLNHRVFVSGAHDEYWSKEMRDGVESARDHGVNLMFMGANASFRRIRLEPSDLGPYRHEVNYRVAKDDPLNGVDPERVTTSWRSEPSPRPESSMIGPLYECNPVDDDMVIAEASSWVFAGTGWTNGSVLPKLVGNEYDRVTPEQPTPPDIEVLSHSPVTCKGVKSFADMTYYTSPSGAGVFATGTFRIEDHMGPPCPPDQMANLDCQVTQMMSNLLTVLSTGPAAGQHPSHNNLADFGIAPHYVNPAPS